MLLFNNKIVNTFQHQTDVQNEVLQNTNKQLMHDIDKEVTDLYISAYQLQQQVVYLQKLITLVSDRKKIIEALVQKGLMQQNDYLLLDIEINSLRYEIQQQHLESAATFNQLNNACGINDTTTYVLTAPLIERSLAAKQFNYQLKFQLDSLAVIAQQESDNTKYKPQLLAYGNTGLNSSYINNAYHNIGLSAGLHLTIPLYDGGQRKITTQQNQLLISSLQDYVVENKIKQENSIVLLDQQIKFTQQSIDLLNIQLKSQETLLEIIKDKVVTGQVSVTDYLNALKDYASANQNKILAEHNLWMMINQYNYLNW